MSFSSWQWPAHWFLAAAIASLPISASAEEGRGDRQPSPLVGLFANTRLWHVDANSGQDLGRGDILFARMADRCTLEISVTGMHPGIHRIALGDLRYVQGDNQTMVEISTRREPARSLIFELQPGENVYAEMIMQLATQGRTCGANLAGPPPLVTTLSQ